MTMPQTELVLKVERGHGRREKIVRVRSRNQTFSIGSAPTADLRVADESVAGFHAVLVQRDSRWYVCDVSGQESLKVDSHSVVEAEINGESEILVGAVRLKLFSSEREARLFRVTAEGSPLTSAAGLECQQVVIRSRTGLLETRLLGATETVEVAGRVLEPATSAAWTEEQVSGLMVSRRLLTRPEAAALAPLHVDRDLKRGAGVGLLLVVSLLALVLMMPSPTPEAAKVLDQKSLDMIFNAQTVKLKRETAKKVERTAKARSGGTNGPDDRRAREAAPEMSQGPVADPTSSRALTSVRNSGLSSLVGKIAKRANRQVAMVASQGVSADQKGSGRAIWSNGSQLGGGGGVAVQAGETFRLGGIATAGRAGGVGNAKDGTALAGGSVGSGLVAIPDEETVIEGGLDRDAIAEVIRRNLGQIRYCYERQLSANPDLYGKVLVRFTIGADGSITENKIDNSTLKSDMVEGCIVRRMASWAFPKPRGGTQVKVTYPFMFKALQ
jgi:TonB family protein